MNALGMDDNTPLHMAVKVCSQTLFVLGSFVYLNWVVL